MVLYDSKFKGHIIAFYPVKSIILNRNKLNLNKRASFLNTQWIWFNVNSAYLTTKITKTQSFCTKRRFTYCISYHNYYLDRPKPNKGSFWANKVKNRFKYHSLYMRNSNNYGLISQIKVFWRQKVLDYERLSHFLRFRLKCIWFEIKCIWFEIN